VIALPQPCVYLVTDRKRLTPDARTTRDELTALETFLDEAIEAGVDVIQVRERDVDGGPLCALVRSVTTRARAASTRVLVNDRADVALAAGAHGVHLRADGPRAGRVRHLGPSDWIVGLSVHTSPEARAARHAGADYILFGTVFSGGSKGDVPDDRLETLRDITRTIRTPVIAIGGIDPARATKCIEAGAAGVAAISIFLPDGRAALAMGVKRATAALRRAMRGRAGCPELPGY
jgi:thiamine-phosphate pyrophosphorylase